MNSYKFSEFYDKLMAQTPYDKWFSFIKDKLGDSKELLELGCGTGELTKRFADCDYKVTAFDISENMLVKAYEKLRKFKTVKILKGDLININIDKKFDGIIATCDVVNYILEERDLEKFIGNSYKLLNKNGSLIFDISSYYKLKHVLGNNTIVDEEDDIFYVWENEFDNNKELCHININFFVKERDIYKRINEIQIQKAYKSLKIRDYLIKAGFKDIGIYDDYENKNTVEKTKRIVFCAKRR